LFPNPSNGKVLVEIKSSFSRKVSFLCLDATGKIIYQTWMEVDEGSSGHPFPIYLPAGLYRVLISDEKQMLDQQTLIIN
jgi:hypothetical protein